MDIALLINARRAGQRAHDDMLRPFGDSSLLEIAFEKLAHLDAPCRKYVAVGEREVRQAAGRHPGLQLIRRSTESLALDATLATTFGHLASLPESWFCVINPSYPLVGAETWWEAIEQFLAEEGTRGLVSVTRSDGMVFDGDGLPINGQSGRLLVANGAFRIVSRDALIRDGLPWSATAAAPATFEIPRAESWGVHEPDDAAAVEAVYSMSQLGLFA